MFLSVFCIFDFRIKYLSNMSKLKKSNSKNKLLKFMRKYHKWPGIALTIFILFFATSGIIMNHRNIFSSIDIPRKYLPSDYRIENWNLASVKSAVQISPDDIIIYGNIGAWLTNNKLDKFIDFNEGFPKGVDNRKVESMLLTREGRLLAGTIFGLFEYDGKKWNEINIPVKEKQITEIIQHNDDIYIMTRSELLITSDLESFSLKILPPPDGYDNKVSLFKTLWTLHSGEMFGKWGIYAVDIFGLALIFLALSGLMHWIFPKWIKKRREKGKPRAKMIKSMLSNLKWHNRVGYLSVFFLIFVAITGMFLRPPLLIPIVNSKVKKIPYSKMDTPNAWYDNLRRIIWDDNLNSFMVSTTEGFFLFDEKFKNPAKPLPIQPPVSVMGCTVLEKVDNLPSFYVIGSFNGLFLWDITSGRIFDYLIGRPHDIHQKITMPISPYLVSGYIETNEGILVFDYSNGIIPLTEYEYKIEMPQGIIDNTPMSLWNVALEVHTGRIFNHLIGQVYVLYVPLVGLTLIIVLISGFFIWWMAHRKRRK